MKKQEKFISKEEKKKTGKLKRAIAVGATTLAAVGLCLNQTGALAYLTDYDHSCAGHFPQLLPSSVHLPWLQPDHRLPHDLSESA